MKYRRLQVIATGQWVSGLFTVAGGEFSVPAKSHRRDIAAALGINPSELRAVDGDRDPGSGGTYLALPVTPPQPTQEQVAYAAASSQAQKNAIFAKHLGLV